MAEGGEYDYQEDDAYYSCNEYPNDETYSWEAGLYAEEDVATAYAAHTYQDPWSPLDLSLIHI